MPSFLGVIDEVRTQIDRLELPFNAYGFDPYGVSRRDLRRFFLPLALAYRFYFHIEHQGIEHVPAQGRAMLIGNHSGGIALDGAMLTTALLLDHQPPRLAQGMIEKFLPRIPFAGTWINRCGHFTGLPEHAIRLLEDERLLMVFPEGARGTAKLFPERHSLVDFGTGFMRLALRTQAPIIPFAFLGGGNAVPTVLNLYRLGRLVGAPYLPITPYLLPVPLPVRLDIVFGEPLRFAGTGAEDDEVVDGYVAEVKDRVAALIETGRHRHEEAGA